MSTIRPCSSIVSSGELNPARRAPGSGGSWGGRTIQLGLISARAVRQDGRRGRPRRIDHQGAGFLHAPAFEVGNPRAEIEESPVGRKRVDPHQLAVGCDQGVACEPDGREQYELARPLAASPDRAGDFARLIDDPYGPVPPLRHEHVPIRRDDEVCAGIRAAPRVEGEFGRRDQFRFDCRPGRGVERFGCARGGGRIGRIAGLQGCGRNGDECRERDEAGAGVGLGGGWGLHGDGQRSVPGIELKSAENPGENRAAMLHETGLRTVGQVVGESATLIGGPTLR